MTTHFSPDAKGWVVRWMHTHSDGSRHDSWWYGPDRGWGSTSGPLDYSVAVWRTKWEATTAARQAGRPLGFGRTVEKVADAVAFAISECDRRKAEVLAGDRPDRAEIAAANDRSKAYLSKAGNG